MAADGIGGRVARILLCRGIMSLVTLIMPAPAGKRGGREATFNILKGICIIGVMLHHLLSFSAREFAVKGAPEWWAFLVTNRLLHFAVPVFLMVSAVLLTRSLTAEARPNWKRFYLRRAQQTLWPYLLWSLLYLLFRAYVISRPGDIRPLLVALPFVETPIPLPGLLVRGDQ